MARAPTSRQRTLADEVWGIFWHLIFARGNRFLETSAALGLTPGETRALLTIDPTEPRAMGELASDWQCDASNVTWIVDRLEEKGLAGRHPHPADRRVKTVALTASGRRTRAQAFARLRKAPDDLLCLPVADLETVLGVLRQLELGTEQTDWIPHPRGRANRAWVAARPSPEPTTTTHRLKIEEGM